MKSKLFLMITVLALLGTGVARLAYTGPSDRSNVPTNIIRLLECDYSTAPDGSPAYSYSQFTNLYDLVGSPQALYWQANYPNLDAPGTPVCTAALVGLGVVAWHPDTIGMSYPPATINVSQTCTIPGNNGWCRAGALNFSASETIPGEKITGIESAASGTLCSINAVSGNCSWVLSEGDSSTNIWANSSFGDSSLMKSIAWKVDHVSPVLSINVPTPDGTNGWFKTAPTLSLVASDALSGLNAAHFSGGGTTQMVSTEGVNTISAVASDNAGNTTAQSATVRLDNSVPVISFAPASPATASGWHANGGITLNASDAVSGIASASYRVDGGAATSMATSTAIALSDGKHSISVSTDDLAGNSGTDSLVNFWVDSTPPALFTTISGMSASGWYSTDVTVTANAFDSLSGIVSTSYKLDGGSWQTGTSVVVQTEGSHNVDFRVIDQASNQASSTRSFQIDKTPPTASFVPSGLHGNNGWFRSMVDLSLSQTDSGSGIASSEYRLNGGTWKPWAGDLHFEDGVNYIQALVSDRAGSQTALGLFVRVDSQAPIIEPAITAASGQNGWYISDVSLSASAIDENSGLSLLEYSLDSGDWMSDAPVRVTTDGDHRITVRATDLAGNQSYVIRDFGVDKTAPTLTLSVPYLPDGQNGWYVTKPVLTLEASDDTSGLAGVVFDDGGSTFSTQDGTQVVSASAQDNAGNVQTISQTLKVDTIPPVLTPSITGTGANPLTGAGDWYNAAVMVSLNTLDSISGIGQTEYRLDGGSWHSGSGLSVSTEGEHTVEMRVTDNAGNVTTASRSFKVDATQPVSAFINPPEGTQIKVAGTVSFTGSSADALSGLASTEISLDSGTTWVPLPSSNGAWSYSWDTTRIPDGLYTILVHADDKAGNRENTARVQVIVGNKPPKVEIQPSWWLWESGYLKVEPSQIPLRDVTLRIACDPNHPDVVLKFNGENYPSDLKWDRLCGNGAYAAESGDYAVTLTACDTFGHCAQDMGVIKVPFIAPPVPTWTPTVMPTSTPMSTATLMPSPALTQIQVTPAPLPSAPPLATPFSWASWGITGGGLIGLYLIYALSTVLDPRPKALRRMRATWRKLSSYE